MKGVVPEYKFVVVMVVFIPVVSFLSLNVGSGLADDEVVVTVVKILIFFTVPVFGTAILRLPTFVVVGARLVKPPN